MKTDRNLDDILESAVISSWTALTRGNETDLIHIEYGFGAGGTVDYLKVWSSLSRGHWLLACGYWMSANRSHDAGVRFENGYESADLAHILDLVMQHQSEFDLPPNLGRQGLLQISIPTKEEIAAAGELVQETFDRLGSTLAEPALV